MLGPYRRLIRAWNNRLDRFVAPKGQDLLAVYRMALRDARPARALHLGSGRDKSELGAWLAAAGATVVSFDIDRVGLGGNASPLRVLGDAHYLPFCNEAFDLVFAEYVFEHLSKPWKVLAEVDRVMRPGGSFIVLTPNRHHYYARVAQATPLWFHQFWLKTGGNHLSHDNFATYHRWGSLGDFRKTAATQRWTIAQLWSTPGPTPYTRWLPIHPLFAAFDRLLSRWRSMHLAYVVHFTKGAS